MNFEALIDRRGVAALPSLFLPREGDSKSQRRGKRALVAAALFALIGVAAALVLFARGHHDLGTTDEVGWGILIATYVFFVASASGLCMVGSLGHVFGVESLTPLAKRSTLLAIVLLLVGFAVIASELEQPLRLLVMAVISPNPAAPIWWMGALYGLYLFTLLPELYFLLVEDHAKARKAGMVSLGVAVMAQANLGAVFGMSRARPYWAGPLTPISFVALALVSGAALLVLLVYVTDYYQNDKQLREEHRPAMETLGKLLALFVAIAAFIAFWRTLSGLAGNRYHLAEVTRALVIGPLFMSFWFFEVLLGAIIPLVVLLGPKRKEPVFIALAAALPVLGLFVVRQNFVLAGQMFSLKPVVGRMGEVISYGPPFKGNVAGLLPYTPSLFEALIVMGALGLAVLLFVVASRVLALKEV